MGGRIRLTRDKLGLKQREFAQRLQVLDVALVSKWERGRVCPEMDTLIRICDLGNVTLDWLVRGLGSGGSIARSPGYMASRSRNRQRTSQKTRRFR